jgi:hypothetical protein
LGGALRGSQTADRQPLKPRPKFTTSACHPEPPGLPFAVPSAKLKRDGVSPSGKAADFDSAMRWFESSHPSFARGVKVAALPQRRRAAPKRNLKQWGPRTAEQFGEKVADFDGACPERGAAAPSRRAIRWFESSHPSFARGVQVAALPQRHAWVSSFDGVYPERSRGAQDDRVGSSFDFAQDDKAGELADDVVTAAIFVVAA